MLLVSVCKNIRTAALWGLELLMVKSCYLDAELTKILQY